MGHLAMGLLWTAPAWFRWEGRASLAFVGLAVAAAPIPDVDLWIERVAPSLVHHHGVTHTVVFVAAVSVAFGAVTATAFDRRPGRWLRGRRVSLERPFVFASAAVLVGGLSHLFADMLSAPDIAQPIEPFWPLFDKPVSLDVLWYDDPLWNAGLLTAAVLLHVGLVRIVDPFGHPDRSIDE